MALTFVAHSSAGPSGCICGVTQSGKPSCCGRGGSWFENCGNQGRGYDHTWFEGLQQCNNADELNAGQETSTEDIVYLESGVSVSSQVYAKLTHLVALTSVVAVMVAVL